MNEEILVTGGSGFIGSNLVARILEQRDSNVTILDRWKSQPIRDLEKRGSRIDFVEGDIRDRKLVRSLVSDADAIFHLASILGTSETLEKYEAEEVVETNVLGTLTILNAARDMDTGKVVYPSTPDVPWLNPYKISKISSEKFCQMFHREYGVNVTVLKLTNVYGPWERWLSCDWGAPYNYQKVIPTFILRALRDEPLPVYGDGEQEAVYTHVRDVARAMELAGWTEDGSGEIIPIGTEEPRTVNEIAELILELTDSSSSIKHQPMRPGEVKVSIDIDTTKANDLLGFTPNVDLRGGIEETIEFYRKHVDS